MSDLLSRYLDGERKEVWAELMTLGGRVRTEPYYSDARAVAAETMRRVRHNVERLIPRLVSIGYSFDHPLAGRLKHEDRDELRRRFPVFAPPRPDVQRQIAELERTAGTLPLSLRTFYEEVGTINLVGSHPALDGRVCLLDALRVNSLDFAIEAHAEFMMGDDEGVPYPLPIAPDKYFKAGFSGGGEYAIEVPNDAADAILLYEPHQTTFVDYLRTCLNWGGLPGLESCPSASSIDVAWLTEGFTPI